jgi:hypothetical protein
MGNKFHPNLGFKLLQSFVVGFSVWLVTMPIAVQALTFVDSTQTNFNTGTYSATQWNGGANNFVRLTAGGRAAGTGTYTSGVKDAGFNASWNSIAWVPTGPYNKELPANLGVETGYIINNVSMTGNNAYYRFNQAVSSTSFPDSSGNSMTGTCVATECPVSGAAGKLNTATTFDGVNDSITVPTSWSTNLNTTSSLAFWIRTTQVGNATFWQAPTVTGIEQSGAGNDIFWGNIDNTGRIALYVGDSGFVKSTNPINNNVWRHVVMTRNATTGDARIYIDGTLNANATLETGNKTTPFTAIGRLESTVGPAGFVYFAGSLDEMASFNRVLSASEVTSMYQRAVLRLLFQVRSCPSVACTGINFEGPDGTTGTFYSELDSPGVGLPIFNLNSLNAPLNRYFQYFIRFQTDNSAITPTLQSVTVDYSQYIPSIALSIRNSADTADTNSCDLGTASTTLVSSCSYRVKVTTNAVSGYVVAVRTSGNLTSGSDSIPNAAAGTGGGGGNNIVAGTALYGAQVLAGSITGGTIGVNSLFNAGATNSVLFNYGSNTNMVTATGPNNPVNSSQSSLVTHNLAIDGGTPAGYYSQSITYSVTATF